MFRANPLKCVPKSVPKTESGVPNVMRRCALNPFLEGGEITFFVGTHGGKSA